MENEVLNGGVSDRFTIALAILAIIVAIVAAIYGRRALFPPQRRLTIYVKHCETRSTGLDPVTTTAITLANTGRHAIESSRFDRERPVVIDLGVPVRSLTIEADRRSREDLPITAHLTTLVMRPDLINPGEYVALLIETDAKPQLEGIAQRTRHALADTVVDSLIGRRRDPVAMKVGSAVFATLALALVTFVVASQSKNLTEFTQYLHESPQVSMTPEYGPPGTCVTVRGKNFGSEEEVDFLSLGIKESKFTPVGACPAFQWKVPVRSTIDGQFLLRFAIPQGSTGTLSFLFWSSGESTPVNFWVA